MQVQTQRKKAIFSLLISAHRGENPRQEAKIRSATSPPPMAKNMPRNTRDAQLFLPHSPQCTQGTCKPDSHVPLNQGNKRLCLKHTLLPIHLKKRKNTLQTVHTGSRLNSTRTRQPPTGTEASPLVPHRPKQN